MPSISGRQIRILRRPAQADQYSRKVQQPAWIPEDACGRRGTVTCTGGRRWTSCRWMACKRSGVRIPVAPLRSVFPGQRLADARPPEPRPGYIRRARRAPCVICAGHRHPGQLRPSLAYPASDARQCDRLWLPAFLQFRHGVKAGSPCRLRHLRPQAGATPGVHRGRGAAFPGTCFPDVPPR
jgi:hypothetical protein